MAEPDVGQETAMSPSRITDFFGARKSSARDGKLKTRVKKSSAVRKVESSPKKNGILMRVKTAESRNSVTYVTSPEKASTISQLPDSSTLQQDLPIKSDAFENHIENNTSTLNTRQVNDTKSEGTSQIEDSKQDTDVKSEGYSQIEERVPMSQPNCNTQQEDIIGNLKDSPFEVAAIASSETHSTEPLKNVEHKNSTGSKDLVKLNRKKKKVVHTQKSVITDFFPVRRSERQVKSEIENEKQLCLTNKILSDCEEGLQVQEFEHKGRGVVATKNFQRGDFVVEYAGELLDVTKARQREDKYKEDAEIGCYMYYFKFGSQQYCVDATAESGRLGRLINHSRSGNCCTKTVMVDDIPRLILVAKRNVKCGEELSYDYGDHSKASLEAHPWLKS